jgi:hypothetical protein
LKSISNLEKFLYRKLFLSSNPSKKYFILNFLSLGRSCLDRMKIERVLFEFKFV